jgi:hypothetical protein
LNEDSRLRGDAYSLVVGKPEGKRPFERPRLEWKDNIKMDLKLVRRTWTGFMWFRIQTKGKLL